MKFKAGDKVIFKDEEVHKRLPRYYPTVGTIGTIIKAYKNQVLVQWPNGCTSLDDIWWCGTERIVPMKEE